MSSSSAMRAVSLLGLPHSTEVGIISAAVPCWRSNAVTPERMTVDADRLAPNIPPSNFWASNPNGINRVRYVYTAVGFKFDYVSVIRDRDLHWDLATNDWLGDLSESHGSIVKRSGDRFTGLFKRTYRVPLTRGLKGCYMYFGDPAMEAATCGRLVALDRRAPERVPSEEPRPTRERFSW